MPMEVEDAAVLWFNKLNHLNTVRYLRKSEPPNKEPSTTKIRIHKNQLVEAKVLPFVKSINQVVHDGRSLLSILLYYFPKVLQVEGKAKIYFFSFVQHLLLNLFILTVFNLLYISFYKYEQIFFCNVWNHWKSFLFYTEMNLSSVLNDRQKMANIELFRSLCAQHLCTSVFALRIDDFFYASNVMKLNYIALICEVLSSCRKLESGRDSLQSDASGEIQLPTINMNEPKNSYQPLLSKRSKKQFAKFEAAMVRDEQKRNNGKQSDSN